MRNKMFFNFFSFLVFFNFFSYVNAGEPIYTGIFSDKAISGYDTVSYFQGDGEPIKGLGKYKTEWRGADWYFSSSANLELFKNNPEKYAPQYGGHCAWAVGKKGTLVEGDPKVYNLLNGKIYLNYDEDVNKKWLPKKEEFIKQADEKYPTLVDF